MPKRESQEIRDTDQARETLSRMLLLEVRRPHRFELPAPYSLMGLSPGDDVVVTHYGGPDADGDGWGSRVFDRGHAQVERIGYDPKTRVFMLGMMDVRNSLLRTLWLPGTSRGQRSREQRGEGIVCPAPRYNYRPNVAYADDAETGLAVQLYYHTPKLTSRGLLVERYRSNNVKSSSVIPTGGWTSNGTGTAGSAIANESGVLLFAYPDPPEGVALAPDNSVSILSGNPHSVDTYRAQTCPDNLTSLVKYCLSVDHFDLNGVPPSVRLQSVVTNKYYNAATPAWQAGSVWNPLTDSGTTAWRRDKIIFPFDAGTGLLNLHIGFPSTAGNAKKTYLAHVQLDMGRSSVAHPWPGSRVVTPNSASDFSEGDVMAISNVATPELGRRVWPASGGTALFTVTPLWASADAPGLTFTVFRVRYDSNNEVKLFYDGTNGRWTFRRKSGGTTTDLTHTHAFAAEAPTTIELRWTSAYGELNDMYGTPGGSNRWFDMIVNGTRVPGTSSVKPVESADSVLFLGGEEGEQFEGYIKAQVVPYVLTEGQCAKWRLAS